MQLDSASSPAAFISLLSAFALVEPEADESDAVVDYLTQQLLSSRGQLVADAIDVDGATRPELVERAARTRSTVLESVEASSFNGEWLPALGWVTSAWAELPFTARLRLRTTIVAWIDEVPACAVEICAAIQPVLASVDEREPLVRAFLRAARKDGEVDDRANAVLSAFDVARESKTLHRMCDEAVNRLAVGSGADTQAVANAVRSRTPHHISLSGATWGEGTATVDATRRLTRLVSDGALATVASNEVAGSDPAPGIEKELRITYVVNGESKVASFREGKEVRLP